MIKPSSVNSIVIWEVKIELVLLGYQWKDASIGNYIPRQIEADIFVTSAKEKIKENTCTLLRLYSCSFKEILCKVYIKMMKESESFLS